MAFPTTTQILVTLLTITLLQRTQAVEYTVTNRAESTPGGQKFTKQIGAGYSIQAMQAATDFIWRLFQQNSPSDRKDVPRVPLFIDDLEPGEVAFSTNNEIHVGDDYIDGLNNDYKRDFSGVIYHEMTHVWQWDGKGEVHRVGRGGLVEGIADFVRLKAGLAPNWGPPGQGQNWYDGYQTTALFLDYCNGLRNGVVAEINKKMRDGYSDDFFRELLGKSVDELWRDYKAMYGTV